jgi:hypothetical protein
MSEGNANQNAILTLKKNKHDINQSYPFNQSEMKSQAASSAIRGSEENTKHS